jgi:hypothetical protein
MVLYSMEIPEKDQKLKGIILGVDFDGTCVTHEYPNIGREIGAPEVLREFIAHGARLILWTMRSGVELEEAVEWFKSNSLPLFGINENPEQKKWTTSQKAYAHFYIDDAAVGAPLVRQASVYKQDDSPRFHMDWKKVKQILLGETT